MIPLAIGSSARLRKQVTVLAKDSLKILVAELVSNVHAHAPLSHLVNVLICRHFCLLKRIGYIITALHLLSLQSTDYLFLNVHR